MLVFTDEAPAYEPIVDLQDAWTHVGHCLWRITLLESALDQLISKLYGTDFVVGQILSVSLDFRKKVQIAQCALPFQNSTPPLSDKEISSFSKPFHAAYDARNVLAHKTYYVQDGKVNFINNNARESLKLAYEAWDNVKFNRQAKKFYELTQFLVEMTCRVNHVVSLDELQSYLSDPSNYYQ